jgi:HlyD family secretion protein
MKPWKKKLLIGLAILALAILAIGGVVWSRRGQVEVQTGTVTRQDLISFVTASGQIEPENYANVNANSIGKVTDIYVKEGQQVRKGQLVLRTQDVEEQADVDAQQAALEAARATLASDEASVASYGAAVRTARADLAQSQAQMVQAKLAYQRGLELLKENLLSKQDFDQRYSTYQVDLATVQSSRAKLAQAQAQYLQAKNTRDMANAQVTQSQAALLRATDVRNQTLYRSPYNGIITDLPVHVGEDEVPGVQNTAGSLLYQVSNLSEIDANVMADETDIASVKRGQHAYVTIDALPDKTFEGVVTEIGQTALSSTTGQATTGGSQTTTSNEEAKQFKVVVRLEDPPTLLRPGLSSTAQIITATVKNAVSIPIQALTTRTKKELTQNEKGGSGKVLAADVQPLTAPASPVGTNPESQDIQGVFAVRNQHAIFLPVKTGIMGNMNMQVLKGLKPGDVIVTGSYSALRTLRNGSKIRVNNTPPQTGEAADSNS